MGIAEPVIKRGRKFGQVLDGARHVFMRDGFEGASVDDIAREAGVSKATLYSYFTDKRLLFMEVAKGECCRQADESIAMITCDVPPREALTIAGTRMVDFFLSFPFRSYIVIFPAVIRFSKSGVASGTAR